MAREKEGGKTFDRQISGQIALAVFTDKQKGFATRGALRRTLEEQGCSADEAKELTREITGSFAIYQNPNITPLFPSLTHLPIKACSLEVRDPVSNKLEPVTLYFNQKVTTEAKAIKAYTEEFEERRRAQKEEAKKPAPQKEKKKGKETPQKTAVVFIAPFSQKRLEEAGIEDLEKKLKELQEQNPKTRGIVMEDLWPEPEKAPFVPVWVMDQPTRAHVLDKGVTMEELRGLILDVRGLLIETSGKVEIAAQYLAALATQKIDEELKASGTSLAMILPVQRELILPVSRLLRTLNQNPPAKGGVTFQAGPKNCYEPYLKEIVEKWAVREISKDTPSSPEEIFSDDVIMKILLGDLLRDVYTTSLKLGDEDDEYTEYTIRCVVDRFSGAEETMPLFLRQEPEPFDFKILQTIRENSTLITELEAERNRLAQKNDPRSRQRREQIPAQIRVLEKKVAGDKKSIAQAQVQQEQKMPRHRVVSALKSRVPRERPQKKGYKDLKSYENDYDAYECFRFLSEDIQLRGKQKKILLPPLPPSR